jgi:hypothetical protein
METAGDRVREQSPSTANEHVDRTTAESVRAHGSSAAATAHRLEEIDREWDLERALFAVTSVNLLLGLIATARDRRWIAWPAAVAAFQFQHAVQGWCPPVSVLRRLGVRTRQEIDAERMALKALRGDFSLDEDRSPELRADEALQAAAR